MKKILSLLFVFVLLFSVMSFVLAEESEGEAEAEAESESESEAEGEAECTEDADCAEGEVCKEGECEQDDDVKAIISPHGAQVRLLQLEKSITRNILAGAQVVEYIQEKYPGADVTELNSILDELELLVEEVQGLPTEGIGEELAQAFVGAKKDARDLSKRFRETARSLLGKADRALIKERVRNMNQNQVQKLNKEIKEKVCLHNAEKLRQFLENAEKEDPDLVEQASNCKIGLKEVKKRVRTVYGSLGDLKKGIVFALITEEVEDGEEFGSNALEKAKANRLEKASQRAEQRSQKLAERAEELEEKGLEKRAERLQKLSEREAKKSENLEERAGQTGNRGNRGE